MDAKVGDWVVTPRRGKAVEINALWYNALRLLADWLHEAQNPEADGLAAHADKTRASFNRRFWHAAGGYLYDVVDGENGDDAAFRPNQIFAIALEHPVLDREYWEAVVTAVHVKLVTPVGLRSLAPGEPDYKPLYFGDLRARDAAYHQGTVLRRARVDLRAKASGVERTPAVHGPSNDPLEEGRINGGG